MEATNVCGMYLANISNVNIERNVFHNLKAGNCAAFRADYNINKLLLANNLFYSCESGGGQFSYHDGDGGAVRIGNVLGSVKIVNNTFADNVHVGSGKDDFSKVISLNLGWSSEGGPIDVRNNIFAGTEEQVRERQAAVVNFRNNAIAGGFTSSQNSGTVLLAPNFVNSSSPLGSDGLYMTADDGYRIQSGSGCINAGSGPDVPATDMAGNPRIQGSAVDIGAYECSGGSVGIAQMGTGGAATRFLRVEKRMILISGISGDYTVTILSQNGIAIKRVAGCNVARIGISGIAKGCYLVRVTGSRTELSRMMTITE